jgi:hypothetical protein
VGWAFCETEHIKTRKDHKCIFCHRIIPKGSPNIYHWHGMYDGEFQNSYACHWCEDYQDSMVDDWDNEILDFWDCIREDLFYDKIQELKKIDEDLEIELEGDYLVFYTYDEKELYREYMPVIRKDDKNENN